MQDWHNGQRVRLRSFNGSVEPPTLVPHDQNYWVLIGRTATVRQDPTEPQLYTYHSGRRVCVQFDQDVSALGLACHNPLQNSLWILESDLEPDVAS